MPALSVAILAAALASRSSAAAPLQAPNSVPLTVRTPRAGFNRLTVSVTLCVPGTSRCTTIDDVMIDTGSTGLRIEASALPASFRLPPFLGAGGAPLAECLRFVHDTAWGPLVRADVHLGGLVAANLPLQVIADGPSAQPQSCPRSQVQPTSNGTLGVGPHLTDCQGACAQVATAPGVFAKLQDGWVPVAGTIAPAYRVPNPIARLPGHDNGLVIDLSTPQGDDAGNVTGTLMLGVGTAANNGLDASPIVTIDARGYFTTLYGGTAYPESYLDSGTMTYVLDDDRLPRCERAPWAFCARPSRTLAATMVGADGRHIAVPFAVGDYDAARAAHVGAVDDAAIAGDRVSKTFVWGAPFFLGRRVAIVMDGKRVPGASDVGPFFSFQPEP